ncbi:nucleotide sugar dehydrogenase [Puteibacter caeruleilacunae]|nr:nucleotide sugar dehydrogenase [Puteibacter caeruleilacunae]
MNNNNPKIAVIGLGYVGLPLAVEFAKKFPVVGFDIKEDRVAELNGGTDSTLEVDDTNLQSVLGNSKDGGLLLTTNLDEIKECNVYIVTVPTPITEDRRPDMTPLIKSSQTVGKVISKGDVVIYESTVYPGATEEVCLPEVEKSSGLVFNEDFYAGYSPERINPGDKVNTLTTIKKVTSGSTEEVADYVDRLYNSILKNGTHKASSLKVAEASKVIENAQRDLNISFVNELALIFDRIGIDTSEVIDAAGSKWNFLKYKPGLVGGHCISVDPYYLKWKAEQLGYQPDVISSGRRVNDMMGRFVAEKMVKLMIQKGHRIKDSNVLVLGITFKENCPDIRNTKVIDVISELEDYGCNVDVCDPWANKEEVKEEYNLRIVPCIDVLESSKYNAILLAVAHDEFVNVSLSELCNGTNSVIYDIKGVLDRDVVDGRL